MNDKAGRVAWDKLPGTSCLGQAALTAVGGTVTLSVQVVFAGYVTARAQIRGGRKVV
jgi:hypothetical protein